jgi:hypothetical protein
VAGLNVFSAPIGAAGHGPPPSLDWKQPRATACGFAKPPLMDDWPNRFKSCQIPEPESLD